MKREDLEANGEEGTKYRKEPSPCPICGKVTTTQVKKIYHQRVQEFRLDVVLTYSLNIFVYTGVLLQE